MEDTDIDDEVRIIVHGWSADWTNVQSDIVLHGIKYSFPKDGQPDLSLLHVFAGYFPRLVAESLGDRSKGYRGLGIISANCSEKISSYLRSKREVFVSGKQSQQEE